MRFDDDNDSAPSIEYDDKILRKKNFTKKHSKGIKNNFDDFRPMGSTGGKKQKFRYNPDDFIEPGLDPQDVDYNEE